MPDYDCIFHNVAVADRYERLRTIPAPVLRYCSLIILRHPICRKANDRLVTLDAGCGRGRFILPLIETGVELGIRVEIVGLDLSQPMLDRLSDQLQDCDESVSLRLLRCDLQEPLPVASGSIGCVFTVATLHILQRWRDALDNMVNVIEPHGKLIIFKENNQFMHQTEGFDHDDDFPVLDPVLSEFMRYYHDRRQAYGCPYEPSPVRYSDMSAALDYARSVGLVEEPCPVPLESLQWQKPHTYGDILHCFRRRQMTTWGSDLPEDVRKRIADELEWWVADRKIDTDAVFHLPAALIPYIFRKP